MRRCYALSSQINEIKNWGWCFNWNMAGHLAHLRDLLRSEFEYVKTTQFDLLKKLTPGQLQASGLAILNLCIESQRTAELGGRTIVTVVPRVGKSGLPAHTFKVGEPVRLQDCHAAQSDLMGVITRIGEASIEVAIEDDDEFVSSGGSWNWLRLVKDANETVYKRQLEAIQTGTELLQLSLEKRELPSNTTSEISFYNPNLNESQRRAVKNALEACTLSLIHGPLGTGKTATLVEVILQIAQRNKRLLVCAPSNLAVDNLVERLEGVRMIRLGHPARILDTVLKHSLEAQIEAEHGDIIRDIRKEIEQMIKEMPKARGEKRAKLRSELKANRNELRSRSKKLESEIVNGAQVVLCTLGMAGCRSIQEVAKKFDVVVLDEGSQATEPESWIAARLSPKLIIAGDHLQLPPTVMHEKELERTLFERLCKLYCDAPCYNLLRTQYRMNRLIMNTVNDRMYGGRLEAHPTVANHTLSTINSNELIESPLVLYDTSGLGYMETSTEEVLVLAESKSNDGEARIAIKHIENLLECGVKAKDIAIITPYNAQVALLREILEERNIQGVECGSVDGFQGREKEAIIFSMVRSNDEHEIGFLEEIRRTNVALTRARRHLCVIADAETLSRNSFYENLFDYLFENALIA